MLGWNNPLYRLTRFETDLGQVGSKDNAAPAFRLAAVNGHFEVKFAVQSQGDVRNGSHQEHYGPPKPARGSSSPVRSLSCDGFDWRRRRHRLWRYYDSTHPHSTVKAQRNFCTSITVRPITSPIDYAPPPYGIELVIWSLGDPECNGRGGE